MAGYHLATIEPGEYGKASKIREEFQEFADAVTQGNQVMVLCELADMLGAIEGWLEANQPNITLQDLIVMKDATRRAFEGGSRRAKISCANGCLGCGVNYGGSKPYWCERCEPK